MSLWRTLFGFDGRIGRGTLWLSGLAILLLDVSVLLVMSGWVRSEYLPNGVPHRPGGALVGPSMGLLVVLLVSAWMGLALKFKRCHDRGRSGWWLLVAFTGIGALWLLVELGFMPGSRRRNSFGDPPDGMDYDGRPQAHDSLPAEPALREPEPPIAPLAPAAVAGLTLGFPEPVPPPEPPLPASAPEDAFERPIAEPPGHEHEHEPAIEPPPTGFEHPPVAHNDALPPRPHVEPHPDPAPEPPIVAEHLLIDHAEPAPPVETQPELPLEAPHHPAPQPPHEFIVPLHTPDEDH